MGGARPGPSEVDDVASTLVWQKGENHPPLPAGAATLNGPGPNPGTTALAGTRLGATAVAPLGATAVSKLGATAVSNMLAATAVGMPPMPEEEVRPGAPSANTLVGLPHGGGAAPAAPRVAGPHPGVPAQPSARTLVGVSMPGSGFEDRGADATARQLPASAPAVAKAEPSPQPAPMPSGTAGGGATTLPQRVMGGANPGQAGPVPPARAAAARGGGAALGAAPPPRAARPGPELGATGTPMLAARKVPGVNEAPHRKKHPLDKRVAVAAKKPAPPNRTAVFAIAGGAAALVAVLVVLLWPTRGAVTARPRVDAEGRDGLDIECSSCPDATAVRIGAVSASVVGKHAFVPISLPLGESKLEVVIDRPGNGKDEVAKVSVHMPYRVTTDLSTLRGERPAIQVIVEAQDGTQVVLDGKTVPLVNGRAVDLLDVTDACTGESDEPRTLSRKIPYVVTAPGRSAEQGTLHVSAPITTLRIHAPGAAVVTDKENFFLAGRTQKGVELFAGPHAIPLRSDGSFAHVMNVSSVGSTQISVRAQGQGMAPRIAKIDVRRVDSLDAAARDFAAKSPLGLLDLSADPKTKIGRTAMVSGFVLGSRSADQVTVIKLRGYGGPACPPLPAATKPESVGDPGPCVVEIAIGAQVSVAPGELVTGCGRFAGTTGEPGSEVPQVRADFMVKGIL
ncbi:MAG: hypothetical protein IPK82_16610 [Polyangiaceae bacterium]|nr:hypothetical protein [Polyangiaceae bacterium]